MGALTPFQKSFNAGELSPRMGGRLDLAKFHDGCRTLENAICQLQGPATRRGAFRFVKEVKTSAKKTRILPFEVGTDAAYVLEVGDQYIRFFKNGSVILGAVTELITNGTFNTGIAGWTDYSTSPASISWDGALQALKFNPQILTPPVIGYAAIAGQAITTIAGHTCTVSVKLLGTGTPYVKVIAGSTLHGYELLWADMSSFGTHTFSFVATGTTSYIEFSTRNDGICVDDVSVLDTTGTSPVEVVTPYIESDLFAVQRAQSADVLYLAHGSYAQQKLARLLANGTSWSFKAINFLPPPTFEDDSDYSGGTIMVALSALTGTGVKVVSNAAVFLAADKDRLLKYLDARASFTAYVGTSEMTAEILDDFPAALIDTTPATTLTSVGTTVTFGAAHGISAAQATAGIWIRLTSGAQTGEMRQVVSVTNATTVVIASAFSFDQVAGVNWSKHYAIAAGSWKLSGSPVATLTPSVATPVGAIATLTLGVAGWRAADVTLGKYVKVASGIVKLTVFTSTTVVSGKIEKPLSGVTAVAGGAWSAEVPSWSIAHGFPSAICFYEQRLGYGGTDRQPTTIWGSASGDYENFAAGVNAGDSFEHALTGLGVNAVRWLIPSKVLMGGTAASEFSIRGDGDAALTPTNPRPLPETNHGSSTIMPVKIGPFVLFVQAQKRKIREITYDFQKDTFVAPDLTRFAEHITEGGGIVDMAYQKEPESILWCVRADGVLLGLTYSREEEVFGWHRHVTDGLFESVAVIPDPVNNRDQLWVVVNRTIGGVTKRYIEYLDPDVVVGDSFVRYQSAAATVITGLSHLEGKAVDVVADGFVVEGHVVAGGQITLAKAASDVTVGLHYETTVEPEPPDYIDDKGRNNINEQKQWAEVILRLYQTGLSGVTINGKTVPARSGSDPLGTAPALFTGDAQTPLLGTTRAGRLIIKQTLPLPFTILAIAGTLDVGD